MYFNATGVVRSRFRSVSLVDMVISDKKIAQVVKHLA